MDTRGKFRELERNVKKCESKPILLLIFCLCYLFLFIILYVYLYSGGGRGEGKAHFSTQSTLTRVVRLKYENQKLFIRPQDMPQCDVNAMYRSGHGVNCVCFLGAMLFDMMSISML